MSRKVEVHKFEDDGAFWVRLWEKPEKDCSQSGIPYIGQGITFCGNTEEDAERRALEFLNNAQRAMNRLKLKVV